MNSYSKSNVERTIRTLQRKEVDRVPNYEVMICSRTTSHLLGREDAETSWWLSPEDHVKVMTSIGQDVMPIPVVDWTLECQEDNESNRIYEGNITNRKKLLKAIPYNYQDHIQPALDRIEQHKEATKGTDLGICAGIGSLIFDRSVYALGFENFMINLYEDRAFIEDVIETYTCYCVDLVRAICQTDIDMIHAGDDVAHKTGLFVNPVLFRELWFARMERIMEPALEKGIPFCYHSDGCLKDMLPMLVELGVSGVNPIEPYSNDIYAIKAEYGDKLTLIGNIDISTLAFCSSDEIEKDVESHLKYLMLGGGYLASSSHSITNDISPENFLTMVNKVHEFGRY